MKQTKKTDKNLRSRKKNVIDNKKKKRKKKSINQTEPRSPEKKKTTKKGNIRKKERQRQFVKEIVISLSLLLGLLFIVQSILFSFPTVEGYGMTPLLNDGERVIVRKIGTIERFDLVCIREPATKKVMIRRIIGLPEEELTYQEDQLFINQQPVVERYLKNELNEAKAEGRLLTDNFSLGTVTDVSRLPKSSYFVLGDNRHYASDSRNFGLIEKKDILGVVKVRLFPLHQMTQF